jgi:hypothetical protein
MKKPEVIKQNSLWKPDHRILFLVLGVIFGAAPSIGSLPRLHRAEASAARLEQIRASIREANNPRPINCEPYISQPWAGHVLLKDWPEGEPKPEVCHLRPEAERLGLVPKSPI